MIVFLVAVEAKPGILPTFEPARDVGGYYQTLGVTARDEDDLKRLVQDHLRADLDSELVEISESWIPDLDGADQDIRKKVGDMGKVGIWYSSGRAWFTPEHEAD